MCQVALATAPVAALLGCGVFDVLIVVVSTAGITIAVLSIVDLVALGSALRAMSRQARGLPPVREGIDYGIGESTWWRTVPAGDPYRAQDRREFVAIGSPSAAARLLAGNLLRRAACVVLPALVLGGVDYVVVTSYRHPDRGSYARVLNTIRSATILYENSHPGSPCPSVEQLKADGVLQRSFSTKDPWGNLFEVACEPDEITVRSSGPDRRRGTEDDIVVPPPVNDP